MKATPGMRTEEVTMIAKAPGLTDQYEMIRRHVSQLCKAIMVFEGSYLWVLGAND